MEDVCPSEPQRKFRYIQTLNTVGLSINTAMLTYAHGNSVGNMHFIWKVAGSTDGDFSQSQQVIEKAKEEIPVFHTRAMRRALFTKFGRVSPGMKPAILRALYRELTNDASAPSNEHEAEIDERVRLVLEMEDPDIIIDLRQLNTGRKGQYDMFWDECKKYLQDSVGTAVDDRRHGTVTHLSTAISVRDLQEQVKARSPEGTNIPSEPWLRLQFWPKTPHARAKVHYTGKLDVKFMVQARQFRKTHEDAHYAAGIFRYQRELAVHLREHATFVSLDDKHRVKVGEPGLPVAAAERGKRVLVSRDSSFEVGDHDFTLFSMIPSVCFIIDIPETIESSWYRGQVLVGLKEAAIEPSSPSRHCTEVNDILLARNLETKPILFLYSDGGPDHRLTYLSVQLSLIALFLQRDLDFLCACRTAPYHSWCNPVERIMSILNLGFQTVGLMRNQVDEASEAKIATCNNLKQLRQVAQSQPAFTEEVLDSIAPVKILLSDIITRLQLKGKPFGVYAAASEEEIEEVWNALHQIDSSLKYGDTYRKASLKSHPSLCEFISHCCQIRHYSFCVKKCGSSSCSICKPPRLPLDVFSKVHFIPDPVPDADGHYKEFKNVYGTATTEKHRPSLQKRPVRTKTLPFVASVQHARNTSLVVQCEECEMWRLLYSPFKLSSPQRQQLSTCLEEYTFTGRLQSLDWTGLDWTDWNGLDSKCPKLYYSF